ncbi:lysyl oxidase family protein [Rubrobacter indicoceani]|uniref:lysyl oxidase family protein n=1 Tax=Rubrobacter indicoceani TaxID=2051957 RepID=UPI000E5C0966|nr:lysyl oxidase family protein [Rubrobacter indicoceani]
MRQVIIAAVIAAGALLFATAASPATGSDPEPSRIPAASDVLPDIGMAHLGNFRVQYTGGKRLLRFDSVVVNTGPGRFEVRGSRPNSGASTMTVSQHVYNSSGGRRILPTDATMYFGGDGHNHWHVRDLESFDLKRVKNNRALRAGAKHGFCFYDNYRFGSRLSPYYTHCGDNTDLVVTMGLSRGWGDIYPYTLPDQYVDITGLPDGRYRMVGTADEANWFRESNEANNITSVNLKISGGSVRVLKYGPGARPVS